MKRALVTGITGQDGRHMSELLTSKGYEVFGLIRGQSNPKASVGCDPAGAFCYPVLTLGITSFRSSNPGR